MALAVNISSTSLALSLLSLGLLYALIHIARVYWRLRHIPGPWWTRFTNLQRVLWVRTGKAHEIHLDIHNKHGDVAVLGPNMVSLANPAWINVVYPTRMGIPKGSFYSTLAPYTKKGALPAVFSSRDEDVHKRLRSPIASLYSMSKVLPLESFINKTIEVMSAQLDARFVDSQETFDLARWLQYFAFDVMGTLTFSKRYGFLEKGVDIGGMLETIWEFMRGAAPFTQIPWLDQVWNKNAFVSMFRGPTGFSILGIVGKFVAERQATKGDSKTIDDGLRERDMLDMFMDIQSNNALPQWTVTAWTFSNVIAGSDSTAVVMRTIFNNLLRHPETMHRLRAELLEADAAKGFTKPYPSWKDVCDLPYLDACVLEGLRMHPPFCLPFERVVPKGGMTVGENYFPQGTIIGMSPYLVNRHKPTFGEDVEDWNPERWMVEKELKARREAAILTFGAGRRVCLGRHIAMLELKKIVPALLLQFDFELRDPARFKTENFWFFRQYGMDVTVKRRV
ncbi:cytochrome P450 [Aspergillus granulosus]|uniref:Cytochrome P450 n=1 Tax=Aspergillus granulosus TaxID=176169 RepID=A0ABR4GZ82_9EURO